MVSTNNPKNKTAPQKRCPVTGLPITHRTDWEYFNPRTNFRVSLDIIGNQMLISRPSGTASSQDVKNSLELSSRVINEVFGKTTGFVQIGDYSTIKGLGLPFKERKRYIETMKQRDTLMGLIFLGVSPALRFSIKLGLRLNPTPVVVKIVDTYSEAVASALKILSKKPSGPHRPVSATETAESVVPAPRVLQHLDWKLRIGEFTTVMEVLDDKILHSFSDGYLRLAHIEHITALRERVRQEKGVEGGFDFIVAGVPKLSGGDWRARHGYMASLRNWHLRWPFQMYVFYGANRFIRTSVKLARPFMPFRVKVAHDFNEALHIVRQHQAEVGPVMSYRGDQFSQDVTPADPIKQYVTDLLSYLGSIKWESDGFSPNIEIDASHPFADVFDALKLLKGELDDLLKEREKGENDLQKAHDMLEVRVAERTAELVAANKELALKVEQRQQMLSALEKSHQELKQTQAQLVQTAKLALLGELTAGIAHELNQPLMVIRANSQLLLKDLRNKLPEAKEFLLPSDMIERNTKRMMDIIGQLRVFSRSSDASHVPVDINKVVEDTFLIAGPPLRRKKITVKKNLALELPFVQGEANRLEQVFLNLITNAVDAMNKRGTLTVTTRQLSRNPDLSLASGEYSSTGNPETGGKSVEILFHDTGSGVADEHRGSLFDPFFTTKKAGQGTGLGLSISYGIIKDHKGEIDLATTGPKGTAMSIKLPAQDTLPIN